MTMTMNLNIIHLSIVLNLLKQSIPGLNWVVTDPSGSVVHSVANFAFSAAAGPESFTILANGLHITIWGISLSTFMYICGGLLGAAFVFNVALGISPLAATLLAGQYLLEGVTRYTNVYNPSLRPLTRGVVTQDNLNYDNNTPEDTVAVLIDRGRTIAADERAARLEGNRIHLTPQEEEALSNASDTDSENSNEPNNFKSSSDPINSSSDNLSSPPASEEGGNVLDQQEILRKWFENLITPFSGDSDLNNDQGILRN